MGSDGGEEFGLFLASGRDGALNVFARFYEARSLERIIRRFVRCAWFCLYYTKRSRNFVCLYIDPLRLDFDTERRQTRNDIRRGWKVFVFRKWKVSFYRFWEKRKSIVYVVLSISTRLRLYESRIFVEFLLDTRLSSKREILFSKFHQNSTLLIVKEIQLVSSNPRCVFDACTRGKPRSE